jgi:ATP-dependent protease Clp ATPase subunit
MERRFVFNLRSFLTQEDMFHYGMSPQFLSRFDSTIMLRDFSSADLVRIFRDIPGAIWPVAVDYFRHAGITLKISDEVVALIADKAVVKNRLGARALREVFGTIMRRLEFDPQATGLVQERNGEQVLEITRDLVEAA